jgi:hypothetical protein
MKKTVESACGAKTKHIIFLKLGFENVSLRAEVHPKIFDLLIEA